MQRRDVLRRGGVTMATVLMAGLAGCSGNSETDTSDNGDDADGDGEPSPTPTPSGPTGEVVENSVSGLEITDWTTTVNMYIGAFGDPSEIARFELTLRCDDFFDEGVYCGDSGN